MIGGGRPLLRENLIDFNGLVLGILRVMNTAVAYG